MRTYPSDPGPGAAKLVAQMMHVTLLSLRGSVPSALIRCGVGTAGSGLAGLIGSLGEARVALIAGRTWRRDEVAVPFESSGVRRELIDWYASDTARDAAVSVLAPLHALGGVRAERLIQTVHVYLDERGSLTRTAQRLNLHRNAVAYRISRAFELLEVDANNPDDLLLLQLACRARELVY